MEQLHRRVAALLIAFLASASFAWAQGPALVTPPAFAQDGSSQRPRRWLNRAEEIEQFMRAAVVLDMEDIGEGVTNPKVCQLAPGGLFQRITFKPIRPGMHNGFYEAYTSEIAAYELDKLLQLGLVLPAVEKSVGGQIGAAVMWMESAKSIKEMGGFPRVPRSQKAQWSLQLAQAMMFHNLVGNTDPNQGNWLVYPHWNLALIDHSRAFTTTTRLVHKLKRVDQELWEQLESLDEAILERAVGTWVDGAGIRAILKRRDKMAEEIGKLVNVGDPPALPGRPPEFDVSGST